MGAKVSDAMKKARKLMASGVTAAEAARQTGLTKGAISQDSVCRKIQDGRKNEKAD